MDPTTANEAPTEATASSSAKRLCHELALLEEYGSWQGITLGPVGGDFFHWAATVAGPPGSPYAGGTFHIDIKVPPEYPFRPPRCCFITPVHHPHICSNGTISCSLLSTHWRPSFTIPSIVMHLQAFLAAPDLMSLGSPLVPDIGAMYAFDRDGYDVKAREWTRRYAWPAPPNIMVRCKRSRAESDDSDEMRLPPAFRRIGSA